MPRDGAATRERILDAAQRLVLARGFAATSVDAVISEAATTKGAFFHHFGSKDDLGRALVARYAAEDERALEGLMAAAEADADDPAEQLIAFLRRFEHATGAIFSTQPGCLFVSFIYERHLSREGTHDLIQGSIRQWRHRLLDKLRAAAAAHPPAVAVDLPSLADQVFTVVEGGFILSRAMDDPDHLRAQLAHLRHYVALLFQVSPDAATPAAAAAAAAAR
jgi:TetR/AcrR family transcriptional repressor of nem operon